MIVRFRTAAVVLFLSLALLATVGCAASRGGRTSADVDDDSAVVRLRAANTHYEAGEWEAARADYSKVLKADPDNVEVHFRLGVLAYGRGDLDEAVERFERARRIDPGHRRAAYNLAVIHLRRAHGALSEYLSLVDAEGGAAGPDADIAALEDVLQAIEGFRAGKGDR